MKKLLLASAILSTSLSGLAQNTGDNGDIEYCGTTKQRDNLFEMHPSYKVQDSIYQAEFQREYEENVRNGMSNERASYVIPVVFHVVHLNGSENISDDQIYDAIRILNEDFQMMNTDVSTVVSSFQGIVGNADVEFRLATKDNNGNCHKGITRTYSQNTYDTGLDFSGHPIVEDVEAQHGLWPSEKYMNVFVCIDPNGAAGYTMTPQGWSQGTMYAGILIKHTYVGSIGTGNYTLARALTHEVGHWLNLAHPWGPNNNPGNTASCGDDDGVGDTPNTIGWTTCNLSGTTCGSLDNVQNYMDYSYCSRMFTQGQVTRMHTALNSGVGGRDNLWTTSNLNATGTNTTTPGLCEADFEANIVTICAGDSVNFTDLSFHNVSSWNWTFTGGTPSSSTDQNPSSIFYNTPGTYAVTLNAGDGATTDSETKSAYITVLPADALPYPYSEGFESITALPTSDYTLVNPDGDGTWQINTNAASTGSKSMYIANSASDDGTVDEFISNTFDLSGISNITMTYDVAFAQRNSGNQDKLSVYVSRDCGKTWAVRKNTSGANLSTAGTTNSNFVPSGSEWETHTITNISSSYLVSGFRYKFEFTSDGGNNVYVDDINITGPLGTPIITDNNINLVIYPNPVEDNLSIRFDMPQDEFVSVDVLDMTGRKVASLYNGNASGHQLLDYDTQQLTAGVYMVSIKLAGQQITKRVVVK